MAKTIKQTLKENWREEIRRFPEMDALGSSDWWIEQRNKEFVELLAEVQSKFLLPEDDDLNGITQPERDAWNGGLLEVHSLILDKIKS